jgi:DNA (cytosine-5)-methyltransferase 1
MEKKIKVGSDFSGVGAFNQALIRLGIYYEEVFSCDMDKYARQTFIHNYGEPAYYPKNVYDREIPKESLDIYMTSPPCQAFSLAGKRLGKADKRGILFFNSHEFIQENKPRFFIFENVKGLLSDSSGKTFSEWVNMLGGKSVNGNPVLFPYEDSVPYHIYWKVLNAKDFNIPQNRERVFIIGIRDDQDNRFTWPMELPLQKRLKDVLEPVVDKKYFLSEKMVNVISHHKNAIIENDNPEKSATIHAGYFKMGGRDQQYIKVKSATKQGYEIANDGDSINFSQINSETRRGRVGKGVAQTLETSCNQGVMIVTNGRSEEEKKRRREHFQKTGKDSGSFKDKQLILKDQDYSDTILANPNQQKEGLVAINNKRLNQTLQKVKLTEGKPVIIDSYNQTVSENSICIDTRINASNNTHLYDGFQIRKLTPREAFRLMDFSDSFTWPVSDSQAYRQAGNSICVGVLAAIISKLKL